ncbi:MAG: hypothetical protein L3J52_00740, partial [Proteobacteria bacterium]|nr:hypothetical protein [Pseudomonadota bacterium]
MKFKDSAHDSAVSHVTGRSEFIDDRAYRQGELSVEILYSPIAYGRIEKLVIKNPSDFSKFKKLTIRVFVPEKDTKLQVQLAIQAGDKWLWQAGKFIDTRKGAWGEISLPLEKLKFLDKVRAIYLIVRSPFSSYQGEVIIDELTLSGDKGSKVLADWEKNANHAGWKASHKYANMKQIKTIRHSSEPAVDIGKGVVSTVDVAARDSSNVYVANTSLGLFRSGDGGVTWSHCSSVPVPVMSVKVSPSNPDVVYAGCGEKGIYRSENRGGTFTKASNGISSGTRIRD